MLWGARLMMAGVRACSTGGDRTGLDLDIDTERRFCRNAEPGPRFPRVALLSLGTRESFFLGAALFLAE